MKRKTDFQKLLNYTHLLAIKEFLLDQHIRMNRCILLAFLEAKNKRPSWKEHIDPVDLNN